MVSPIDERIRPNTSLELLYHVSRELATAIDLPTVLRQVLFLSMRNINALTGSMIVLDESGQPIDSIIIIGNQVLDNTTRDLRVILERGLAGVVARTLQAALIPDTSRDERWLRRPDDAEDRTGPKSAVSVPLMVRDKLVGVLTLVHSKPGFFTQDHLALVQAIADQAGIAVLNARLYAESQRQARVMTAVAETAAEITASLHLEEVLQRVLEQISQALRVEVVSLALIDHDKNELVYRATTDHSKHSVVGMRLKMGQGIAGWVAQHGEGVVVPEVNKDERFYAEIDGITGFETRAIACAPIRTRGNVIGVLQALNPISGVFDLDALLVLTGIGSLAGTAIRHAQLFESLQAAHRRYRDLFEDSIDPILITDWNGLILEANRQALQFTQYQKNELLEMQISQLHSLNSEITGSALEKIRGGETITYESILTAQSGRAIHIQVYVREVNLEGGSSLQWILRDISERVNLDNLRTDLISMIYHDLRSPLANVVSSLDVMDSLLPLDREPSLRSMLNIALRSTERIQRLTSSLLDINRLEAGQPVGNCQPVLPTTLINDAVEAVIPTAHNKNQQVSQGVPNDLPKVLVEVDMVRRVLSNLLENAVKFTPPGGIIDLTARQEGDWVLVCVRDTGPGIPPEDQERIFDKFIRLQSNDNAKGFGLGLAYCKIAIEGHGGNIWVESQPGAGSSFCFTLPIVKE